MIIKGGPRAKGGELAVHLMRADTNETVTVMGRRGVYSKTVKGALREMAAVAAGSKAKEPLYHVSINPEADERLTQAQWELAADRLEKALGMEGHQRVMVMHLKQGKDGVLREHMHVVWGRVNVNTMKAAHHSHNYRTHEEVARSLEREFGLKRTQGVHAELDGQEKKQERRPKQKDSMQEAKTGWKKADAMAAIAAAWNAGDTGKAFRAYLEEAGYRLARGDTRDFVVIDPAGGVHSIRSGVRGLKVAEVRSRFVDIDQNRLPGVAEAQKLARATWPDYKAAREAEQVKRIFPAKPARPVRPTVNRYAPVAQAQQTALVNRNIKYRLDMKTPQPAPTPPTWARDPGYSSVTRPVAVPSPVPRADEPARPSAPVKSVAPASAPTEPTAEEPTALAKLRQAQDSRWRETVADLIMMHRDAHSQLDRHHEKRLAEMVADIDRRLKELNGFVSRAGAVLNDDERLSRDNEIAYLVAKRQRSVVDETARQEKLKEELRRAHEKEIEDARHKHFMLSEMQRKVLEVRLARTVSTRAAKPLPTQTPPKSRDDLER